MSHNVIAVNKFWGTIFASLLIALITTSVAYAWNTGQQVVLLKSQVDDIRQEKTPEKIAGIQQDIAGIKKDVNNIKDNVSGIGNKLERSNDTLHQILGRLPAR